MGELRIGELRELESWENWRDKKIGELTKIGEWRELESGENSIGGLRTLES